jgi:hypothetical protein
MVQVRTAISLIGTDDSATRPGINRLLWGIQDRGASRRIASGHQLLLFIDAADRGVILAKVQNYFNRIRFGNPAVDFIARRSYSPRPFHGRHARVITFSITASVTHK